ncbi:MAG: hypothetical protein A2Z95_04415 [Gallionellales bacterium GWA2_60_18]|nr:MAG: hypothetical protein A2Z95_04415 [Gallionellales bacterium GWA2_60_18]
MKFDIQQRAFVAALATALIAPAAALADTGNVTIYGLLNVDYESAHNDKSAAINHQRVSSNASRLGFKGAEDLGDGLKAFYQLETQVDMTGAGGTGTFNGSRNTAVGLEGSFGTVFMGIWDTPFKVTHNKVELFDNTTSFSATDLIGRESLSGASFVVRQTSVVQYCSPNLKGFQAKLAYKPGGESTPAAAGIHVNKTAVSLSATYENDLLYAAYGYESHKDNKTTTAGGTYTAVANLTDSANRVVGAYKFTDGQVGLTYERLAAATTVASTATVSRNAWELSGKYKMGNSNFSAYYTRANDTSGTADSGATQFALRYGNNLSKHTELWGAYTRLDNDTNGQYAFANNAFGAATADATLSALGMGMIHSF